ncbi:transposase [Streptomyces sp. NPDC002917]|uniref:transposase n=1 Tax=unclassified Streptomyces TaxID=2593676 RepID=UPI0033A55CFA
MGPGFPVGTTAGEAVFWNWGPCLAPCRDDPGVGRRDLSDDQWAVLGPLLPVAVLGRPSVCRRRLIDGIRRRVRTGAPWRDLPAEYGPWQTVCGRFRRWQRDGTWDVARTGLQARADCGRADHPGDQRRLHDLPGPPARGRCPA